MTEREQAQHFAEDLDRLVTRYAKEFDLSYAAVIGVLQMKVTLLCNDSQKETETE